MADTLTHLRPAGGRRSTQKATGSECGAWLAEQGWVASRQAAASAMFHTMRLCAMPLVALAGIVVISAAASGAGVGTKGAGTGAGMAIDRRTITVPHLTGIFVSLDNGTSARTVQVGTR